MKLLQGLIIISVYLLSTSIGSNSSIRKRNDEVTDEIFDYNCGEINFSHEAVQAAASMGYRYLKRSARYPIKFSSPLYDKSIDLVIWPVKKDGRSFKLKQDKPGVYFVVMDMNGGVKDVIVKTMMLKYIKCKKLSRTNPVPKLDTNENTDGYDCGYDYFGDQQLEDVAALALEKIRQNSKVYHQHKIEDSGPNFNHILWPLIKSRNYNTLEWTQSSFFIVLSLTGEVKDLMVKLIDSSLFQCPRVRLADRPLDDEEESLKNTGYQCGLFFYGMDYLIRSAGFSGRIRTSSYKKLYPITYSGAPFYTQVYLYPIFPWGRFFIKGRASNHFVVTNNKFDVIDVVIKSGDDYHSCETRTRSIEMMKETSNFNCERFEFQHDHLLAVTKIVSQNFGKKNRKYPAVYKGPNFDIPGPYITWPLNMNNFFRNAIGNYRIVLNGELHIAGVLEKREGEFHKCKRASDQSIPGGEEVGKIYEIHYAYRLDIE